MPEPAIQVAVQEAHDRGKPVFAHPTTREGLMASVRAGVDVLVHTTPQSGPWDRTILAAMKQANVSLVPTLKLWRYEARHERASVAASFVRTGVEQLRAWHRAGGDILFGTDVGYMSEYDPSDEYMLMALAGMGFRDILASLTTAPANRFGVFKDQGRIAPGFIADLTVLRGDPARDITAFATVAYTVRGGRFIYREKTQ